MNQKLIKVLGIIAIIAIIIVIGIVVIPREETLVEEPVAETPVKEDAVVEEPLDPRAKYIEKFDPPIVVTAVDRILPGMTFIEGESLENNIWTDKYYERLGIDLQHKWITTAEEFETRLNLAIAADDLPDIFPLTGHGGAGHRFLKMLREAGKIMDITELYEVHAAPWVKERLEAHGPSFSTAKYDDRLWAIISSVGPFDFASMLWIRADWLERLNQTLPETMDDVLRISEAFTIMDPDGNNVDDTFGLAVHMGLWGGGFAELRGFAAGFHAWPGAWLKDAATGNLVFSSIQPEMRTVLKHLQEMYRLGQIDPEFSIKDSPKVAEDVAAGRIGMIFGQSWIAGWPLQDLKNLDNEAEWHVIPLVSSDYRPAKNIVGVPVYVFYAINRNMENPEAAIRMLNLRVLADTDPEEIEKFRALEKERYPEHPGIHGRYGFFWNPHPLGTILSARNMREVLAAQDRGMIAIPGLELSFDNIMKYLEGDIAQWSANKILGEGGSWHILDYYVVNNLFMPHQFFGPPTETMAEKGAVLGTMATETFTRIIMGEAPIEEFDRFIEEWKAVGGADITREVNEWYRARK